MTRAVSHNTHLRVHQSSLHQLPYTAPRLFHYTFKDYLHKFIQGIISNQYLTPSTRPERRLSSPRKQNPPTAIPLQWKPIPKKPKCTRKLSKKHHGYVRCAFRLCFTLSTPMHEVRPKLKDICRA